MNHQTQNNLAHGPLIPAMNFARFCESGGRKEEPAAGLGKPASAAALQAALDTEGKLANETPAPAPGPDLPLLSNNALADNMTVIENALSLSGEQAVLMKRELLGIAFSPGERTADRLKAMQMLTEMSALNKKDRSRQANQPSNQVTVFNVLQTVKGAKDIAERNHTVELTQPDDNTSRQ